MEVDDEGKMTLALGTSQRAQLTEMARRLGLWHPRFSGAPNVSALIRGLADRYREEPEPTIALVAAALGIDQIKEPAQD